MYNYLLRIKRKLQKCNCKFVIVSLTRWGPNRYLFLAKKSLLHKNDKGAETFIKKGLKKYPNHSDLNQYLAQLYSRQKKWQVSIQYWNVYFTNAKNAGSVSDYLQFATAYEMVKDFNSLESIILKGLEFHPDSRELSIKYYNAAVSAGKWDLAITRLEKYTDIFQSEGPSNELVMLSMMQQLIGNHEKAKRILSGTISNYRVELEDGSQGYRRIRIFDNGETVIDFYKQLYKTNTVVITFDSINKVLKSPPFGFKVLNEQKVDIIAVRKRKAGTNQQDLSKEAFEKATQNLVKGYKDKVAYGYSLGAYLALYLTPNLNCRVLAISPRIPAHPKYGEKKAIKKETFSHQLEIPKDVNRSPIIIFDPKNKMDVKYMNQGLKKSFPNGNFTELPYGGHGMARHLINMGVLKEYIITFIYSKKIPKYNRKIKDKSSIYFRLLAKECLEHNKLKWAEDLVDQSLEMLPNDGHAIKVKTNLLKKRGLYDEAQAVLETAVKEKPNELKHRLMLIDYLIKLGRHKDAMKELNESFKVFGRKSHLKNRERKLVRSV